MSESVEATGATVEEAIERALDQLDAREDEVEIQILSDGESGDPQQRSGAKVRVRFRDERSEDHRVEPERVGRDEERRKISPEEAERQVEATKTFLRGLLDVMELDDVDVEVRATPYGAAAEIHGEDLAILIGRHGATLAAIQDVTRAAVQQATGVRAGITVDIEGYFERRIEILERIAREAAEQVKRTGRALELEPMTSRERKVVHDTLTGMPGIETTSEGAEPYRFVVVLPE